MSNDKYAAIVGIVQHFPEKELVSEREVAGQTVREFTVKSIASGKLVRITLWPEFEDVDIQKGTTISADGKINVKDGNNGMKFYGLTPTTLCVIPPIAKTPREDAPDTTTDDEGGPVF